MQLNFTIPAQAQGKRLDQALRVLLPDYTRSRLQSFLRDGLVLVDGIAARAAQRAISGQAVRLNLPAPQPLRLIPAALALDILYEDRHIVIVNKAPGMVVHPAPGHHEGTLVHGLLHHCRDLAGIAGSLRPGIVHRLDKDTSGAMVAAKDDDAHQGLVQAFARGEVQKTYLALVWGQPASAGRIEKPIGRHPVQRQRMSTLSRRGKPALTTWQVLRCYCGPLSLLRVNIHTGRTHQIRVHMADAGFPIVGDALYGGKQAGRPLAGSGQIAPRQMLHAWSLSFRHPLTGQTVDVTAELPDDFTSLLKNLTEAAPC